MMKMLSGYNQAFRCEVVRSVINAFEIMMENEKRGIRPIHRPKEWHKAERLEQKEMKKKDWYKQGGFDSVIFVPSTPDGELKRLYHHAIRGELQRSNPFREGNCRRADCFICTSGGKGNCETESITYIVDCQGGNCRKNVYKGETSTNGYTRGAEHLEKLAARNIDQSPMWRHCVEEHGSEVQSFMMSVTGSFKDDAMIRQITEAVQINNTDPNSLMNDRAEWNMTRVPRTVISAS